MKHIFHSSSTTGTEAQITSWRCPAVKPTLPPANSRPERLSWRNQEMGVENKVEDTKNYRGKLKIYSKQNEMVSWSTEY